MIDQERGRVDLQDPAEPGPISRPIPTWSLFAGLAVLNLLILVYFNRVVLSDAAIRHVLGTVLSGGGLEEQIARLRRTVGWGYLVSPLTLLLRIAFVTLVLQLVLLVLGQERPFRSLFRAVAWGYLFVFFGAAVQAIWLSLLDPGSLTADHFQVVPGSIASFLFPIEKAKTAVYALLSQVSVFDLGFMGVVVLGVVREGEMRWRTAIVSVASCWALVAALKWALLLLSRLMGT